MYEQTFDSRHKEREQKMVIKRDFFFRKYCCISQFSQTYEPFIFLSLKI